VVNWLVLLFSRFLFVERLKMEAYLGKKDETYQRASTIVKETPTDGCYL
jgi:hypothetical protein